MISLYKGGLLLSIALLFIASLGQFGIGVSYGNYPPRQWEVFDSSLVNRTSNMDELYNVALLQINKYTDLSQKDIMLILYDTVTKRFTHGDKAKHSLFSNWLLYLLGKVHSSFAYIWEPDLMLKYGHSILCGNSSYILIQMALRYGIPVRHVGLQGHVVMEAYYGNTWHMYDPDMEVIPMDKEGNILGVNRLAKNSTLIRKAYNQRGDQQYIESLVTIFQNRKTHTFVGYPQGAWFAWKVDVLHLFQRVAEYLKFIIPVLILLISLLGLRLNKNKVVT